MITESALEKNSLNITACCCRSTTDLPWLLHVCSNLAVCGMMSTGTMRNHYAHTAMSRKFAKDLFYCKFFKLWLPTTTRPVRVCKLTTPVWGLYCRYTFQNTWQDQYLQPQHTLYTNYFASLNSSFSLTNPFNLKPDTVASTKRYNTKVCKVCTSQF